MALLGDKKRRWESAEAQLRPGRIVLLPTIDASHEKFVIVAAIDPVLLGFYISSEIHELHRRNGTDAYHVPILAKDHPRYLRKERSYANCAEVVTRVSRRAALTHIVTTNELCLKGGVTQAERGLIIAALNAAPTVSEAHRRIILAGF